MKVLIINQVPEVNNKYTFSLARALMKKDVEVTVCGIEDDDVSTYSDVPFIDIFGSYSKEHGPVNKVLSYRKSWMNIIAYCKSNNVDIVHVQWYIFSPLDYIYHNKLRKLGINVVTTIHDLLPFNKKFYDFHYHRKIYSHADKVINQARMNKETLIKDFGVSEDKIIYIPHGHYMEYAEHATMIESREKLGIPVDKKVILFFGQIKKVKGVDILIQAMKAVSDKHKDVLCVIAGKVWKDDYSIYQNMIDELGISDYIRSDIRFIDDDEIKYYFNAADIVALPYLQIYQSGVVLLGYAYKKPLVATTEGEFLSVVKDKETGLLVPAGDSEKLAEALNWYLDNPDKAIEFGEKGYEDISVRLSWDTIADSLSGVYREILK